MTPDLASNPFAVLSAVAAPAILTNACSVLALGTGNRIARVVDRSRVVIALQAAAKLHEGAHESYTAQLNRLFKRSALLIRALRLFYAALGMFASTALTAIIGSAFVGLDIPLGFHLAALLGLLLGCTAVIAVVFGCYLMVRETRLAIQSIAAEHMEVQTGAHLP